MDFNFGAKPVSFVMGDGSLLPGFERRLLGMRPGDEAEFRIPPEEGFGTPQDDNIQSIPERILTAMRRWSPACCSVLLTPLVARSQE